MLTFPFPRSSRRISVAFRIFTTIGASRPPIRAPYSRSEWPDRLGMSLAPLMDPFTGTNDEDDGEPLSPARTIISVGANA
jgi:hypothetical protein